MGVWQLPTQVAKAQAAAAAAVAVAEAHLANGRNLSNLALVLVLAMAMALAIDRWRAAQLTFAARTNKESDTAQLSTAQRRVESTRVEPAEWGN